MKTLLPTPLRGIVPPIVTPLAAPGVLDESGLERIIRLNLEAGVDGLFLLGTMGEAPNLSLRMKREVLRTAAVIVDGRIPLLAGITGCAFEESVQLAEFAAECGVAGLVFAAPYYYPLSQEELLSYSLNLADALPLPFFVYDIPSHTRNHFERRTVRAISRHPLCAGIKDSSGDWDNFVGLMEDFRDRPEFAVLVGPEQLFERALLAGCHGAVPGGANLHPHLYVQAYRAAVEGRTDEVMALGRVVGRIIDEIYGASEGGASYLRGLKCALEMKGLCSGLLTESFVPLNEEQRAKVRATLESLGLL